MSAITATLCFVLLGCPVGLGVSPPDAGRTEADNTTKLPPLNVFEGRVVDQAGKPVAGATVAAADAERGFIAYHGPEFIYQYAPKDRLLFFFTKRNGNGAEQTTTDSDGRFEIKGLRAGRYRLLAAHAEAGVTIMGDVEQPNAGDPVEVRLDPPTFLEGTVPGIEPAAKVDIQFHTTTVLEKPAEPIALPSAWRHAELTPVNERDSVMLRPEVSIKPDGGGFRAGPLPGGGQWTLHVETYVPVRGFSATVLTVPVDLEPGRVNRLEVDLTKGLEVAGQVRGPKGEPLEDVSVLLRSSGERPYEYGAITDPAGKYRLVGLPEGSYTLEAKRWAKRTAPG